MRARYDIQPEATAKRRRLKRGFEMPTPMQDALKLGIVRPGDSLFDYGEGHGELCPELRQRGIRCAGWDKYQPGSMHKPKVRSDVVALNFVLNTTPDPVERREALREADSLARRDLVIGVRGKDDEAATKTKIPYPKGGGFLVRRSGKWTFQKFYTAEEFVSYVTRVLGPRPIRVLRNDPVVVVVGRARR